MCQFKAASTDVTGTAVQQLDQLLAEVCILHVHVCIYQATCCVKNIFCF